MDLQARYALSRWLREVPAQEIARWIERPHLLKPHLVGVSESVEVVDRQTNGDSVWLNLAVWVSPVSGLTTWPHDSGIPPGPLWLLTNWSEDPGVQHLLAALTVTDSLSDLLDSWPSAAAAIPLNSDWLDDAGRTLLALRAAAS